MIREVTMIGKEWDLRHLGGACILIGVILLIAGSIPAGLVFCVAGAALLLTGIVVNKMSDDESREDDSKEDNTGEDDTDDEE